MQHAFDCITFLRALKIRLTWCAEWAIKVTLQLCSATIVTLKDPAVTSCYWHLHKSAALPPSASRCHCGAVTAGTLNAAEPVVSQAGSAQISHSTLECLISFQSCSGSGALLIILSPTGWKFIFDVLWTSWTKWVLWHLQLFDFNLKMMKNSKWPLDGKDILSFTQNHKLYDFNWNLLLGFEPFTSQGFENHFLFVQMHQNPYILSQSL